MPDKRCVTCGTRKPREAFNLRRSAPDGRQDRCRDCCKRWYVEHRAAHMATVGVRKRRVRAEYRELMGAYLRAHPCVDCGERDIRVLEFDHRPGEDKVNDVATLMGRQMPWRRILAEVEKCDVRCANCHRRRTAERGGHWRHLLLIRLAVEQLAEERRQQAG